MCSALVCELLVTLNGSRACAGAQVREQVRRRVSAKAQLPVASVGVLVGQHDEPSRRRCTAVQAQDDTDPETNFGCKWWGYIPGRAAHMLLALGRRPEKCGQ